MSGFVGDWHGCSILMIAGFLPNEVWRLAGLWFASGVDEGSEVLVWVRAVATAILAGVIAQILVQPPGALASVPDWLRYGADRAGFEPSCWGGDRPSPVSSPAKSCCWPGNRGSVDCRGRAQSATVWRNQERPRGKTEMHWRKITAPRLL